MRMPLARSTPEYEPQADAGAGAEILAEYGFRGLHDGNGLFEGYGRRLPGGGTVYAVDASGEPALAGSFTLKLAQAQNERTDRIRAAIRNGGEDALRDISEFVASWTMRQLRSGHPNPYCAVFHQLRPHRLVEEPRSTRNFLHQAERALKLSATLFERDDDATARLFMSGCMAAAGRCAHLDENRVHVPSVLILLSQIASHFLAPGIPSACALERLRRRAAGEMLHQIAENGRKIL